MCKCVKWGVQTHHIQKLIQNLIVPRHLGRCYGRTGQIQHGSVSINILACVSGSLCPYLHILLIKKKKEEVWGGGGGGGGEKTVKLFRSRIPCKVNESGQRNRLRQQAITLHCNEQREILLADWWAGRENTQGERGGGGQEKAFSDGVAQTC